MPAASEASVVTAYFAKESDGESAIQELKSAGFSPNDIRRPDAGDAALSNRSLTSDEYSTSSAQIAATESSAPLKEKVRHVLSGEPADSDINDHPVTGRAHEQGGYAGTTAAGMGAAYAYHDRETQVQHVVTVYARDRVADAQQILLRHGGEIQSGNPRGTPGGARSREGDRPPEGR
jgi:hypothetical protein